MKGRRQENNRIERKKGKWRGESNDERKNVRKGKKGKTMRGEKRTKQEENCRREEKDKRHLL